jgi:NAD(P)-dependent dehydrogenase (short-subunit alcohol dehydrogenase family)
MPGTKLTNKVAIITGGGQGIGRGIAVRFASEGAKIVIAQRRQLRAETTVREIGAVGGEALAVQTDVRRLADVRTLIKKTMEHFGRLDILVNNAGRAGGNGRFLELGLNTWREVIGVNLTGVFLCSQAAARAMSAQGIHGRIINIGSLNSFVAQKDAAAYAASKGGVLLLTKAMAVDLAEYGILVNCLVPGSIRVKRNMSFLDRAPIKMALGKAIPLGHPGNVADVAGAAVFLASDDSAFVTGTSLVVDGGYLAHARIE